MTNYNYQLTERGNFTKHDFENKIQTAIREISKKLELPVLDFKQIRESSNQGYTVDLENFGGTYIVFNIYNSEENIGELNCFFDEIKGFIEIRS